MRDLARRKLRTTLTILGITIGIWALVVFGSMANKINALVEGGSTYAGIRGPAARTVALEALALVGLAERSDHRPAELSGGEQQRVALARALVNKPQLVLADEPTGNLDSERSAEILALLRHSNEQDGQTIVLVTHDAEVAAACDRVIRVRDGRIQPPLA